jgi:hypothetical protein
MNTRAILLSLMIFPAMIFAQTEPAADTWGLDYEGKRIVAVLPLAGEETAMALRFYQGIMEAVAALEKYSPRQVQISALGGAGAEIPTDMPPNRSLTPAARYALTGGVYPGNKAYEYYLQLWLWDMSGSTMIYTDDLVYEDIEEAMLSLPGLVEWLFSHIREVVIETPRPPVIRDPLLMLGLRAGLSQRWYTASDETSAGASAIVWEGGVSGALRISPLFALQTEVIFTQDTLVYRGLSGADEIYNVKYNSYSLMVPLLAKLNFRPGGFRVSLLAGLYAAAPLGQTRYSKSGGDTHSYSWSFSVPLGFTAGLEAAADYGPGMLLAGLRYAGDFGNIHIDDGQSYRRDMVSVYLGYEFDFFDTNK